MWEPAQVDVLFLLDAPEAISELQAISDAGAGGSPVARGVGDLTKIWSYNGDLCIYMAMSQNPGTIREPQVIAGKWMFIPLNMYL